MSTVDGWPCWTRAKAASRAARPSTRPTNIEVPKPGLTSYIMSPHETGHQSRLAAALRDLGRPSMRASLDDFKHPWARAVPDGARYA